MLGDEAAARTEAESALSFARDRDLPLIELAALHTLGALGDAPEQALDALERAVRLAQRNQFRPWLVLIREDLSAHLAAAGRGGDAQEVGEAAAALRAEIGL